MENLHLITGGCGFIGKHLALHMHSDKVPVRIFDSLSPQVHGLAPDLGWLEQSGIELIRGSVTDVDACDRALDGVRCVFHLAAETGTGQSMYEMSRYMDTNVRGTAVLLDACVRARVPQVVLSSSRAVYGEGSWRCDACGPVHPGLRLPSKEGTAITWNPLCPRCRRPAASLLPTHEGESADPVSVYGISKLAQEQLVDMAGRAFGLDCSILRFFNVFGPGQSLSNPYTGVLAVFVNRARLGRPLDLYEDGRIVRDFVHVDDVVRALMLAAEKRPRCPVNIGSGRTVTIGEIAGMVVRLTRSSSPLQITGKSRVGDVRGLVADLSRAGTALGWAPEVAFEDGLRSFVEWASRSAPTDSYEGSLAELKDKGLYQ